MDKINHLEKSSAEKEKIRDIKDVCLGYFFLIFGYFFFVTISFWLISSKINPPPEEIINKFPIIIQFFIRDKSYGIILIIILPTILILSSLKKFSLYSFRH